MEREDYIDDYLNDDFFGEQKYEDEYTLYNTEINNDDDVEIKEFLESPSVIEEAVKNENIDLILSTDPHSSYVLEYSIVYRKHHITQLVSMSIDLLIHSIQAGNNRAFRYIYNHYKRTQSDVDVDKFAIENAILYNRGVILLHVLESSHESVYFALYTAYIHEKIRLCKLILRQFIYTDIVEYRSDYICELAKDAVHKNNNLIPELYYLALRHHDANCVHQLHDAYVLRVMLL